DALWGDKQIQEIERSGTVDLGQLESRFLTAGRRAARRRRLVPRVAAVAALVLVGGTFAAARLRGRRGLAPRVMQKLGAARVALETARHDRQSVMDTRQQAFAAFDRMDRAQGERLWSEAFEGARRVDASFEQAERVAETAIALDGR